MMGFNYSPPSSIINDNPFWLAKHILDSIRIAEPRVTTEMEHYRVTVCDTAAGRGAV
jgi:hypothetical protein